MHTQTIAIMALDHSRLANFHIVLKRLHSFVYKAGQNKKSSRIVFFVREVYIYIYTYHLATSITDIFAGSWLKSKALLLGNIKIKNTINRKG